MKTHQLIQGSPEWIAFRFEHFGASEAAAMLGISPHMTRTELLHMKHVGSAKEFSQYVQERVLNRGHAVEALARPVIEKLIGEELYPVTCSEGNQSASCDGLTMAEQIAFECKQRNKALADSVAAGVLPEEYMPQCQQVLKITKAEKLVFAVSDGTPEGTITLDVYPSSEWFDRIDKGWAQFERDLAAYVPAAPEVKAIGATPETLPALFVELTGAVTASNLDAYKEHALAVIGAINRDLQTDQDFADASKAVKWCGDVESRLKAVKEHALSQTQTIDQLFKAIDDITAKARDTRLELDKLVTRRNSERKEEIVLGGKTAYQAHLVSLKAETEGLWIELPTPDFAGSIRGMRLFANMQDAVNTLLANSKIAADDSAKKIRTNLALIKVDGAGYEFLFNDRASLVAKAADDLKLLIKSRIDAQIAAKAREEEATRERIRSEEQAKAARAVQIQARIDAFAVAGEPLDVRTADEIGSIIRTVSETVLSADLLDDRVADAKAAKDSALKRLNDAFYAASQKANTAAAEERKRVAGADPAPAAPAPVMTHTQVVQQMPASVRQAMAPKPTTEPTLTLGTISNRLCFSVTSVFLASLGFEAITVKASKLFHEEDFPAICEAIKTHISEVQDQFEPATA